MRALALTHVYPRHETDAQAPFLATWVTALRQAGHDVRVIAPHDAGLREVGVVGGVPVRLVRYASDAREVLAYRGEMHRIALRPTGPPLVASLLWQMAGALRRAVRRFRPDVVVVHWWMPGMVIARMAGIDVPVVAHLHGTDVGLVEQRPALRPLARWALDRADRTEAVSRPLARLAGRTIGRRVDAVNPMPIDLDRFTTVDRVVSLATPIVLGVGRLVPEKGFADLIDAAAATPTEVVVRILGEGPEMAALAARARRQGVVLQLPGQVAPSSLPAEYAAADVVVQPSHREGLGLVAAEAVLSGRPTIATDSGGVRDILDAPLLVRVGDVAALAARIEESLRDPDLAAVVRAARRVTRTLSPGASVERTVGGWAHVVRASRRG